jgi:hypothetical protein
VVATIGDSSGQNVSEALQVDPFDSATVWLVTGYRGLFKSTNCGAAGSWVHVNTGKNGPELDGESHNVLVMDPVDKGVMYLQSYPGGGLLKSTNGGVDFDQLFGPDSEVVQVVTEDFVNGIAMDPLDHKHLVVNFHQNCAGPYAPTCEAETSDAGEHWRIFSAPDHVNWEEGAGMWILGAKAWLYGGLHLWLTTDDGATFNNLTPDPSPEWGFTGMTHAILQGPDGALYIPSGQGVVQSHDMGQSWTLIPSSGGSTVGLAMGNGNFYSCDQWSPSFHTASVADPTTWKPFPAPVAFPSTHGCPFLAYDAQHAMLYASCFDSGTWRTKTP